MKPNHLIVIFVYLTCLFTTSVLVNAGQTVMSTSDSAPLYPTSGINKNTEVVVGTTGILNSTTNPATVTTTVTLTTKSDDGGDVYVSYTPSDGMTEVSDTGWGTPQETVTYSFENSCIGVENTVSTSVNHNGTDLNTCSTNVQTGYTICIPTITLTDQINTDVSNLFWCDIWVDVAGLDDFSQVCFQQWVTATSTLTDPTSGAVNNPTGTYNNYSGWDGGVSSPVELTTALAYHDTHSHNITPVYTDSNSLAQTIQFCGVYYGTIQMFDYLTRSGSGNAQVAQLNWGYQAGNDNNVITAPTLPSGYATGSLIQVIVPSGSAACKWEVNHPYGGLPLSSP